jgi:hypothetical protein
MEAGWPFSPPHASYADADVVPACTTATARGGHRRRRFPECRLAHTHHHASPWIPLVRVGGAVSRKSGFLPAHPHPHYHPLPPPPVCLLRIFGRFQKSLRSRWGLGPCNQSIASGFGATEIKSGFWRFLTVFGRLAAPFRALARVEAALARRSDHSGFARRSGSVRAVKTINGSRWRVP